MVSWTKKINTSKIKNDRHIKLIATFSEDYYYLRLLVNFLFCYRTRKGETCAVKNGALSCLNVCLMFSKKFNPLCTKLTLKHSHSLLFGIFVGVIELDRAGKICHKPSAHLQHISDFCLNKTVRPFWWKRELKMSLRLTESFLTIWDSPSAMLIGALSLFVTFVLWRRNDFSIFFFVCKH